MPRAIWKGAITFGLVHLPVALHPASHEEEIDFDWLDKRSMDPVGYKRINKRTGREIDKDHIVKGVRQDNGDYVVLSEQEVAAAYPRRTQTIEMEAFVDARELAFVYLERPYFLEPVDKGQKVYALLRRAMAQAGVVGIARVVMHTKEHLAALIASDTALMLNTLRWSNEVRAADGLDIAPASAAGLKDTELKMAGQLIKDMTTRWNPAQYSDRFTEAIHALIARKVKAGRTHTVEPFEPALEPASNVVDLTELLRRSLGTKNKSRAAAPAKAPAKTARKTAARKTARKTARDTARESATERRAAACKRV